jgi:hypothetical protein
MSTFEKVMSQTRPSWLPPKDKVEDETHYHQWEDMMTQAREHEKELKKMAEARRLMREKRLMANTPRWEALLASDFSVTKVKGDVGLRKMWFEGVPSHLRGKAWSLAVGNALALSRGVSRRLRRVQPGAMAYGRCLQVLRRSCETVDRLWPVPTIYTRSARARHDGHAAHFATLPTGKPDA